MYRYMHILQNNINFWLNFRDHPLFSAFLQEYREYARGRGKSSSMLSKMLVLATVLVHEASSANQHFYSMPLGEGGDM